MNTNQEFVINFKGHGNVTVPKSTSVKSITGGGGKLFYYISDTTFMCEQLSHSISVLSHDLKYYYVYIDEKFVNKT